MCSSSETTDSIAKRSRTSVALGIGKEKAMAPRKREVVLTDEVAKTMLQDWLWTKRRMLPEAVSTPSISEALVLAVSALARSIENAFFQRIYKTVPNLEPGMNWRLQIDDGDVFVVIEEEDDGEESHSEDDGPGSRLEDHDPSFGPFSLN